MMRCSFLYFPFVFFDLLQRAESLVRVVSYKGEWACPCGTRHFMQDPCSTCSHPSPCRCAAQR